MSWNLTLENEEIVMLLTVEQNSVATALAAAIRAEAAKAETEAASAIAVTQAGIATQKATEAGTSEANSLANKNAAIQAKTDSESAATTATAQAVTATEKADQTALDARATAADRIVTGQDRIQTGQDRIATGQDRGQTTADATATAADRVATAADRIQTGEDVLATAASASNAATSESNALTYKDQAEGLKNNSQTILTDIQALLPNFPKPSVFALNKRGIAESATFARKLKPVNNTVKALEALNPSLVLDPSVIKAGKLFSVIPDDGTGDFTVSRNGTGTYLGSDGLLKTALANEPRLEFNPDGTFKGVLVEPSATNLFIRSEAFEFWGTQNSNASLGIGLTPEGLPFRKVICTASGFNQIYLQNVATINQIYSFTLIVKKGTSKRIAFNIGSSRWSNVVYTFDSDSFSGSINSLANASSELIGEGWVKITYKGIIALKTQFSIYQFENSGIAVDGIAGNYFFISRAQFETGSVATSYIPTFGSTVTRPADVITRTNVANLIGQTEGSVYFEFVHTNFNQNVGLFGLTNSSNPFDFRVGFRYQVSSGVLNAFIKNVNALTGINHTVPVIGQRYKLLLVYNESSYKFFVNGAYIGVFNSPILPVVNRIDYGSLSGLYSVNNSKSAALFKTALTDAQAIALTTL